MALTLFLIIEFILLLALLIYAGWSRADLLDRIKKLGVLKTK